MDIREAITEVVEGRDLSVDSAADVMRQIFGGSGFDSSAFCGSAFDISSLDMSILTNRFSTILISNVFPIYYLVNNLIYNIYLIIISRYYLNS